MPELAHKVVWIDVVGLTPRLLAQAPTLSALAARGSTGSLTGVVPAVTLPAQATALTGLAPDGHGVVGNGWFHPETGEVRFWVQSAAQMGGEAVYDAARRLAAAQGREVTTAKVFGWFAQGDGTDVAVTPKPHYGSDGSKAFGITGRPADVCPALERELGPFPFASFWGPRAGLASTTWIAAAAASILRSRRPDFTIVYLPHLDYDLQRFGPDHPGTAARVAEVDAAAKTVIDAAHAIGHSFEMLNGRFPFGKPSADHIPFPYQPAYSALVAGLGAIFGLSLPLARSVSIAATLACAALVGYAVGRETQSRSWAVLAGLAVFSFYGVTGFWYDLARVDSLFLALLLAGLCAAKYATRARWAALGSGLCLVLAYKTKQLALPFFVLVPPLLYSRSRAAVLGFVVLCVTLLGVDFWWSQKISDGWFGFFMNDVPRGQPYQPWEFARLVLVLLSQVPLFLVLALVGSDGVWRGASLAARSRQTWSLATLIGCLATLAAWARPGGWSNNLLTTYVFAVIPAAVGAHRIAERGSELERRLLYPLLALQLGWLLYDPRPQIPTRDDYVAGQQLVTLLRATPGPVLVPDRPWLAVLAGKSPSYHSNGYWELGFQKRPEARVPDLEQRLAQRYYSLVVVQVPPRPGHNAPAMWPRALIDLYRCDEKLSLKGRALKPFTGLMAPGPTLICRFDPEAPGRR